MENKGALVGSKEEREEDEEGANGDGGNGKSTPEK